MSAALEASLEELERRLRAKGLFGRGSDSVSLRVPGARSALCFSEGTEPRMVDFDDPADGVAALHTFAYSARPDVGGIVLGVTPWSSALEALGVPVPSLFDEQARHIGRPAEPVADGDGVGLEKALGTGTNAFVIGGKRLGLGATPNRVVLNADLFEKCAKAFVLAASTGEPVRALPDWASELWYERLRKDQLRAAAAYASGRVPDGMDGY